MFATSAITCPCHLVLVLPVALALLAGTSLAVWLSQNVGWVAGAMTFVFLTSLLLGLRWMKQTSVPGCISSSPATQEQA